MATTQYIGARYVPLFYTASDDSNNWESGVQYDPLTIVTYLNQSYTSKIPVPASVGNPADNPDYWILTGAYSAQVEQYRQEVVQYEQDVLAYRNDVLGKARSIVVISDSFGTKDGGGSMLSQDLGEALTAYLGWDASYIHFNGRNSAGFYNDYYADQLDAVAGAMTADERAEVKDLYIVGGWNDNNKTEATVRSKAAAFKSAANGYFVNATLHTVFVGYGYVSPVGTLNAVIAAREIYNSLDGFVSHPNAWYGLHDPALFLSGSDHPNNDGMKMLADVLGHVVDTGDVSVEKFHTINSGLTLRNAAFTDAASYTFREVLSNAITNINLFGVRLFAALNSVETLNLHNGAFVIGTINGLYMRGQYGNFGTNVVMSFYDASYVKTLVPGSIAIHDGTIEFTPDDAKNNSGGNDSISVKYYTVPMFGLTTYSR